MTFSKLINGDSASKYKSHQTYLLTNYIKSILWRVEVRLSYL